jgi:hypothetical protein
MNSSVWGDIRDVFFFGWLNLDDTSTQGGSSRTGFVVRRASGLLLEAREVAMEGGLSCASFPRSMDTKGDQSIPINQAPINLNEKAWRLGN